jgi:hypothetical protein
MQKRTIQLGQWFVKSYKRSDKCELVYVPIAFNILDDEQREDLLYVLAAPNRAGRVRDCVRMVRLGQVVASTPTGTVVFGGVPDDIDDDITDDDVLNSLID